jgi:hypothetical protein
MGDENSLQGQTKAHKHSSPSSDGGHIASNVTGMTGTSNGSIIYFDGSSIAQNLPAGNLNDVLTMGASVPAWASGGSSASCTTQTITPTNGQTTSSSPYVDVSNSTITLPSRSGFAYLSGMAMVKCSSAPANIGFGIYEGGALQTTQTVYLTQAGGEEFVCVSYMCALSGQDVKLQWRISGGTATMVNTSILTSRFQSFEVG